MTTMLEIKPARTASPPVPGQPRLSEPLTRDVVDYVLRAAWDDLPERVRSESARAFVNWVGCAFGGVPTETTGAGLRFVAPITGAPRCRVLGRSERLDPVNAALINCLTASAHAYDDTHLKTVTHPTAPVAAAAVAIGEAHGRSGRDIALALLLGMEIECRVADELMAPGTGASGSWYMTGVAGGIGAAVAAGRLLGLDRQRLTWAISLAAAQASGFRVTHGSMACAVVPAFAARDGVTAALMAQAGLTSSEIPFEGTHGYLHVFGPGADGSRLAADLGRRFEMLENAFKPYPCGIVIHPAIDACLELTDRSAIAPEAIARVELDVPALSLTLTGRRNPRTPLEAQVSLFHWVAATLVSGEAGLKQLEAACLSDPRVVALQDRIVATADDRLAPDQTRCRIVRTDGSVMETFIEHATGSLDKPMTEQQLARKFRGQVEPVLGAQRAGVLLDLCSALPQQRDISAIMSAAVP